MTEYWVSQGNKWCDFCKIFLSNNPSSIRNHELGQRHKDNVAKRLTDMRKEKAAKEKQQQEAAKAIQQIEAKAKRSYQKDVASFQETRDSNSQALDGVDGDERWKFDSTSGYYYDQSTGLHYDPNSGFYYSDAIGKWVTREEAYASDPIADAKSKGPTVGKPASISRESKAKEEHGNSKMQKGTPPGPVVSASLNPMRLAKGAAPSSVAVKRKRQDEKPKVISKEEAAALKAREAAKKRVEEREKPLLGLYRSR